MNEKLQYAEMLEIPISTCNVTYRPPKKKKFAIKKKVDSEEVKELLLKKVNESQEENDISSNVIEETEHILEKDISLEKENDNEQGVVLNEQEKTIVVRKKEKDKKSIFKKFKIGVVGVELAVIGALIATIFLTNAINTNSGINVFMRNVFGTEQTAPVDNKEYTDFAPTLPVDSFSNVNVEDGVITLHGEASVYAPCSGTVTSLEMGEDGKFSLEITHNENFKTTINGLNYVYCEKGDNVYSTLPVGYINGGEATMCFFSAGDNLIKDYAIEENTVVWKSLD